MRHIIDKEVEVIDKSKVLNDIFLHDEALEIIKESDFKGHVTKVEDDIYFVGFKNKRGWVTQGYKVDEIKEVE